MKRIFMPLIAALCVFALQAAAAEGPLRVMEQALRAKGFAFSGQNAPETDPKESRA